MTDSTPIPTPKSRGLTPNLFALSIAALVALSVLIGLLVSTRVFTQPVHYPDTFAEALGGAFLVSILPFLWLMIRRFDYRKASGPLQLWATLAILFGAVVLYGHWAETSLQAATTTKSLIMPIHEVAYGIKMPFPDAPSTYEALVDNKWEEMYWAPYYGEDGISYSGTVAPFAFEKTRWPATADALKKYVQDSFDKRPDMYVVSSKSSIVSGYPAIALEIASFENSAFQYKFRLYVLANRGIHTWTVVSSNAESIGRGLEIFRSNYERITIPMHVSTAAEIRRDFLASVQEPRLDHAEIEKELAEAMFRFTARVSEETRLFRDRLQEVGFPFLLDPERLASDQRYEMAQSFSILDATDALMHQQIQKAQQLTNEARAEVKGITGTLARQHRLLQVFDRAATDTNSVFLLEQELLRSYRSLFEVLSRDSEWAVVDGRVLFQNRTAMNQFNRYMIAIKELTEQQQEKLDSAAMHIDQVLEEAEARLH